MKSLENDHLFMLCDESVGLINSSKVNAEMIMLKVLKVAFES